MAVIYDMSHIDAMEGHEFEQFIANLLRKLGYQNVEVTPGSGDQGVDVLAEKEDVRYAVQCKCYSSDLGNTPVQEVNTGKVIYHCHVGIVVTNRYFTQGAKEAAKATGVLLWDRSKLMALLAQTQMGISGEKTTQQRKNNADIEKSSQTTKAHLALIRESISKAAPLISAGSDYLMGVKWDGTVITAGNFILRYQYHICEWNDIVAIATDGAVSIIAAGCFTIGLKSNGTVISEIDRKEYECDVSGWTNIVAVATGGYHAVGLKSDGTVVAAKSNNNCVDEGECNVNDWVDIIAIVAGCSYTVGLKSNGTVVATGDNECGQCDIESWTDIVAIAAGTDHTIGLKSDGTVIATGSNGDGQCNVYGWTDIVAIATGYNLTAGLKSDGTVVAVGENDLGQCRNVNNWTQIVAISADGLHVVGLKSDGTVISTNGDIQNLVSGWKLFNNFDTLEQEQSEARALKEAEVEAERRRQIEQAEAERRRQEERTEAERRYIEELTRKKTALEVEQATLQAELVNLKGLFTGRRRRELEARLAEIEQMLKNIV